MSSKTDCSVFGERCRRIAKRYENDTLFIVKVRF